MLGVAILTFLLICALLSFVGFDSVGFSSRSRLVWVTVFSTVVGALLVSLSVYGLSWVFNVSIFGNSL